MSAVLGGRNRTERAAPWKRLIRLSDIRMRRETMASTITWLVVQTEPSRDMITYRGSSFAAPIFAALVASVFSSARA